MISVPTPIIPKTPFTQQNVANSSNYNPSSTKSTKQYLSVVWGKRSSKKHKIWEGDGTLEVVGKSITLRDSEGKYLGSSTAKPEELDEGCRLIMGSNELEIIEKLNAPPPICRPKRKNSTEEKEEEGNVKKSKTTTAPKLVLTNSANMPAKKRMNFNQKVEAKRTFLMPNPSKEHQEKFNPNGRTVKEVAVAENLTHALRPHQREGILFLFECIMGYRNVNFTGCILADEMGLGKTLQCITVCHTLLKEGPYGIPEATKVLVKEFKKKK